MLLAYTFARALLGMWHKSKQAGKAIPCPLGL